MRYWWAEKNRSCRSYRTCLRYEIIFSIHIRSDEQLAGRSACLSRKKRKCKFSLEFKFIFTCCVLSKNASKKSNIAKEAETKLWWRERIDDPNNSNFHWLALRWLFFHQFANSFIRWPTAILLSHIRFLSIFQIFFCRPHPSDETTKKRTKWRCESPKPNQAHIVSSSPRASCAWLKRFSFFTGFQSNYAVPFCSIGMI